MKENKNEFKSIKNNTSAEITEKKSRFIANVIYVETNEEAEENIKKIKKEHYNAKHNCFAYIVMGENNERIKRFSDDGEPAGTAGAPILEILEKQNLSNVLVVVTRYFGGILLGTGGLLRAYSGATLEALENVEFVDKTVGYEVEIIANYKDAEQLKYNLEKENIKIININYGENVELLAEIPETIVDKILEKNQNKIIKTNIKTKKYVDI